jgi:hypothetical protein
MSRITPHHDPACWGCGDNPAGLHLPHRAADGLTEHFLRTPEGRAAAERRAAQSTS